MTPQAVKGVAKWYDAVAIGGVRLHLSRVGAVLSWKLTGSPATLTKAQTAELVAVYWRRVRMGRGSLDAAWSFLIPAPQEFGGPLSGGIGWPGPINGVVYVDRQ